MNQLPNEILPQIAEHLHPVNRMAMRLSRARIHRAIGPPTREETIAAMLHHAAKDKRWTVSVTCHRLPGPLQFRSWWANGGWRLGQLSFDPLPDRSQKGRFRVGYVPGSLDPNLNEDPFLILSNNATLHECITFLQNHCYARVAMFTWNPLQNNREPPRYFFHFPMH